MGTTEWSHLIGDAPRSHPRSSCAHWQHSVGTGARELELWGQPLAIPEVEIRPVNIWENGCHSLKMSLLRQMKAQNLLPEDSALIRLSHTVQSSQSKRLRCCPQGGASDTPQSLQRGILGKLDLGKC